MIIISNQDPVYLSWLHRHRDGYVLDTQCNPTAGDTEFHRATCAKIKTASRRLFE